MQSRERDFEVPNGYYIKIYDGNRGQLDNYRNWVSGVSVDVYQSLEGFNNIEHVRRIGTFRIPDSRSMQLEEFLKEVRLGIEKVTDPSKR